MTKKLIVAGMLTLLLSCCKVEISDKVDSKIIVVEDSFAEGTLRQILNISVNKTAEDAAGEFNSSIIWSWDAPNVAREAEKTEFQYLGKGVIPDSLPVTLSFKWADQDFAFETALQKHEIITYLDSVVIPLRLNLLHHYPANDGKDLWFNDLTISLGARTLTVMNLEEHLYDIIYEHSLNQ